MKLFKLLLLWVTVLTIIISASYILPGYLGGPTDVSIIPLITNSWFYHAKKVRTRGFLKLDFEAYNLHLSKESYEQGLGNFIWLNLSADQMTEYKPLDMQYVVVEGTFDAMRGGSRGYVGIGTFSKVTDLRKIEPKRMSEKPRCSVEGEKALIP